MRRLLALTCAIVLVDTVFYATLTPLVPYFAEEHGLSKSLVGILSGAFGAGVLLGSAPAGYLTARLGVKPAALAGLFLMSVASLFFGFAGEAWELVALRLLGGFGSALSWVSAFTWVVARAPEEQRGQMIGTLLSAAVAGVLLGPVLGSAAGAVGVPLAFALVCAAGLAVAVWAWATPGPSERYSAGGARTLAAVFQPRPAAGLWLIGFSPLLFGVLSVLAPLQLSRLGWGAAAIGVVFFVAALLEATLHPLVGRWSDRAGYRPPVLAGLFASLVLLLALAFPAGEPLLAALLVVLASVAFSIVLVPGTALFTRGAEKAGVEGALAFGAANFAWASGYAAGAFLGGTLADLGGDALSYLSLAAICVVAVSFLTISFLGRNLGAVSEGLIRVAGMVGPALFATVTAVLTVAQYDFMLAIGWRPLADPAGAWPSGLALGPYGWAQSLTFAISGLLLIFFALGLHRGMMEGSKIGPALLALSGVAMSLLVFETDPITGSRTPHGWVHDLAFVLFITSLAPAFFFLWRRMERDSLWKSYGRYTLVTGVLSVPLFLLPGPTYYLSLVLILAWLEILAIRLWISGRRTAPSRKFRNGTKS